MKVVILAGGFGTRLSEYTERIPKPMVQIGGKPILWHIMQIYAKFEYKNFYLALGYKADIVKDYFVNYHTLNADFTVDLASGVVKPQRIDPVDWKVTLVNTGEVSMTGGRFKRMKPYIGDETCMLTYGDGVADIDIAALVDFHRSHGKMITVSAVHPNARFGELDIRGEQVETFKEKPQMARGWINGGFFIVEPSFFDMIDSDTTVLEKEPLERAAQMGELMAYKHHGYWQCMDTKRDRDHLEELWASGEAPWRASR